MENFNPIKQLLNRIYGEASGQLALERIQPIIENFPAEQRKKKGYFSENDAILITYGDSLKKEGRVPVASLHEFAVDHLEGVMSGIHFLPFFPYSSDDGFSVIDFFAIDPALGGWEDVKAIGKNFDLMFDYVLNHFSSKSNWFKSYLEGKKGFSKFAIEVDPATDLSKVTRPFCPSIRNWTAPMFIYGPPSAPIKLILTLRAWMSSKK
jgi:sucrose phosphorylase